MMALLAWTCSFLALLPAALAVWNMRALRAPAPCTRGPRLVSVLIPARNEAANIGAAVDSVLASVGANIELIVLDDASTDTTAEVLRERQQHDPRLQVLRGAALPRGVRGKPFACEQLASAAQGEALIFMDADVRLAPDAVARIVGALSASQAALISGIPRQITCTFAEKLIVPFMHIILLCYLPIVFMRRRGEPAFGAACGQLIAVDAHAYRTSGGHAAVASKVHDGIALARNFRAHGLRTDLVDVTPLASCRMYASMREVVSGFAKNAHEGLGSPRGIVPWTLVIAGGHVLPAVLLPGVWADAALRWPLLLAVLLAFLTRCGVALRFKQNFATIPLHPLGAGALLAIQWYALARRTLGRPVLWKQRDPTLVR